VLREFYVTCRVEKWYVDEGTESHGPYLSRQDAIADAVEAAKLLAKPKKPVEVILKGTGIGSQVYLELQEVFRFPIELFCRGGSEAARRRWSVTPLYQNCSVVRKLPPLLKTGYAWNDVYKAA